MTESVRKRFNKSVGYSPKHNDLEKSAVAKTKGMLLAEDLVSHAGNKIDLMDLVKAGVISSKEYHILRAKKLKLLSSYDIDPSYKKHQEYLRRKYGDRHNPLYTKKEQQAFKLMDMTTDMLAANSVQRKYTKPDSVTRLMNHLTRQGYTYAGARQRILHTALQLRKSNLKQEHKIRHAMKYHPIYDSHKIPGYIHKPGIKPFNKNEKQDRLDQKKRKDNVINQKLRRQLAKLHHGDKFLAHCFDYFAVNPAKYHDTYPSYPKVDQKYHAEAKSSSNPDMYDALGQSILQIQRRTGDSPLDSLDKLRSKMLSTAQSTNPYDHVMKEFSENRRHEIAQRKAAKALNAKKRKESKISHHRHHYNFHKKNSKPWLKTKGTKNSSHKQSSKPKKSYNKTQGKYRKRPRNPEDEGPEM